MYVHASLGDCVCIVLPSQFVLGFCLSVLLLFCFVSLQFSELVIIGGFVLWFGCSLLSFFLFFFFLLLYFLITLFYYCFFFLSSFLPFLLSCVADRVLVLWPGVRAEPQRWESRVQDTGPPQTSGPHVISLREMAPRDLCLNNKTQLHSTTSKLHCWTPYAKQLARQEHNPTH